jgi:hypothetical protein
MLKNSGRYNRIILAWAASEPQPWVEIVIAIVSGNGAKQAIRFACSPVAEA